MEGPGIVLYPQLSAALLKVCFHGRTAGEGLLPVSLPSGATEAFRSAA